MTGGAVVFDRDGVLVRARVEAGRPFPVADPADAVEPGAPELLARLRAAGWGLAVVTNQPDIARGTTTADRVARDHDRLAVRLGLPREAFLVCPHDDVDDCACRKPRPGLVRAAAAWCGVGPDRAVVVGDRWRDVGAAQAAGASAVWIDRGYAERRPQPPYRRVGSLAAAVAPLLAG